MTMNRIRSRWTRRTIAFLIVLNTAIWASFTLSRGHSHALSRGAGAVHSAAAPHR